MKKFIIEQVEKRLPDQAELIKNNIDMMMGILKLESTEKAVYTLSPDGWARKIVVEKCQNIMGKKMSANVTTTLNENP